MGIINRAGQRSILTGIAIFVFVQIMIAVVTCDNPDTYSLCDGTKSVLFYVSVTPVIMPVIVYMIARYRIQSFINTAHMMLNIQKGRCYKCGVVITIGSLTINDDHAICSRCAELIT